MSAGKMRTLMPNRLFYASRRARFLKPGVVLWTGKRHVRLLPLPKVKP